MPIVNFWHQSPEKWKNYKNNFNETTLKALLNIANPLDGTPDDENKLDQFVKYYVGSIDNIDFKHLQGLIDMYTDGAFLYGSYRWLFEKWNGCGHCPL